MQGTSPQPISTTRMLTCGPCQGTGTIDYNDGPGPCPHCHGTGMTDRLPSTLEWRVEHLTWGVCVTAWGGPNREEGGLVAVFEREEEAFTTARLFNENRRKALRKVVRF